MVFWNIDTISLALLRATVDDNLLNCRYLTGQVDKRTLEKYEREAKEKNRESWLVFKLKF